MAYGINCYIWDVAHGDAIYVDAADRDVAINMGSRDQFSPFEHIANRHGVRELDYLIASHLHYDHISDISNLDEFNGGDPRLLTYSQTAVELLKERLSEADDDESIIDAGNEFLELAQQYTSSEEDPSSPDWADRATFTNASLTEMDDLGSDLHRQLNNSSIITAIEREGYKIVVTGDLMEDGLKALMESSDALDLVENANVLVAPHHGRESGFYGPFVEHVGPDVVVFSDKGNEDDNSASSQYYHYTSGVNVYNEVSGEWEEDKHVLTTRTDGRILIKANTASSWQIRKRPVSTTQHRASTT